LLFLGTCDVSLISERLHTVLVDLTDYGKCAFAASMAAAKPKNYSKAGWLLKQEEASPAAGSAAAWQRYFGVCTTNWSTLFEASPLCAMIDQVLYISLLQVLRGHELLLLLNEGKVGSLNRLRRHASACGLYARCPC
jgi:hypothetical protein